MEDFDGNAERHLRLVEAFSKDRKLLKTFFIFEGGQKQNRKRWLAPVDATAEPTQLNTKVLNWQ